MTPSSQVAEVNETSLTVTAVVNSNVTHPRFEFNFGDGSRAITSNLNTAEHIYREQGEYRVTVNATSACNARSLADGVDVIVPPPVEILRGLTLQSEATELGEPTEFVLQTERGTQFNCTWFFGDGGSFAAAFLSAKKSVLNHTFPSPFDYTTTISCRNRRSEANFSLITSVQSKVTGLLVSQPRPVRFGFAFKVQWTTEEGSDIEYYAEFQGRNLEVVKFEDGHSGYAWITKDEYETPGKFEIKINASNAVTSPISRSIIVHILRAVVPFHPVVLHHAEYIEINETITVWMSDVNAKAQTNVSYNIDFADGTPVMVTQNASVTHAYKHHGIYIVNITGENMVSRLFANVTVQVHKPVLILEDLKLTSSPSKVNESTDLAAHLAQGSDFKCHWSFGDGENKTHDYGRRFDFPEEKSYRESSNLRDISFSADHIYQTIGVFAVLVTCRNRLSFVSCETRVTVQEEIGGFHVFPIEPKIAGKTFPINWSITKGTHVSFSVTFKQNEISFKLQGGLYVSLVTPEMYHMKPGEYDVMVTASNLVTSLLRHQQRILIEVPVSRLQINASYEVHGRLLYGHGTEHNHFPTSVPISFKALVDNGTNLQYTWSFAEGQSTQRRSGDATVLTFHKVGIYRVGLQVRNQVSKADASLLVMLQEPVSLRNEDIACPTATVINKTTGISLFIETLGTNSCLAVNFKDGTGYAFGSERSCEFFTSKLDSKNVFLGVIKKFMQFTHVYKSSGVFEIELELTNVVSLSTGRCTVEITARPCRKPRVKLMNSGRSASEPEIFPRAEQIHIVPDIDSFCPNSAKIVFRWNISQYRPKNDTFQTFHMDTDGVLSAPHLRLPQRTLPIGLFEVSLTVGFQEDELKDYHAVEKCYLRIVQSALVAKISGGSRVRRGLGSSVLMRGLESHDPDMGPGNYEGERASERVSE